MRNPVAVFIPFLLVPVSLAQSPRWAIDAGCDNTGELKRRDGIVSAMAEARERASTALKVIHDHAEDDRVKALFKMVLGEEDLDGNLEAVRNSLEGVASYEENPAKPGIGTDEWQESRTYNDLQIYCDPNRYKPREGKPSFSNGAWEDRVTLSLTMEREVMGCYNDKSIVKAMTGNSHTKNFANPLPPGAPTHFEHQRFPFTMDFCPPYMKKMNDEGFPRVTKDLVNFVRSPKGRTKLEERNSRSPWELVPVDLLKTIGSTMLHELTHTRPGGQAVDKPANECYDWICVLKVKSGRNADSISLLALALQLWTMNFQVNKDGTIQEFQ